MAQLIVQKQDIIDNYRLLKEHCGVPVIPVLKANGYGLGARGLFAILKEEGCPLVAVSRIEEALPLSGQGVEILILSCGSGEGYIDTLLAQGLTCSIGDLAFAKALSQKAMEIGKKARAHIKIDTGMGRFGFLPDQIEALAEVFALPGLEITGIFSHLYGAFLTDGSAQKQLQLFKDTLAALEQKGIALPMRHIANSTAAVKGGEFTLDAVRIGSALTGRLPVPTNLPLKRAGRLEAEILSVRQLKKGSNIGYGAVCKLKRDTTVAVVGLGSADGFYQSEKRDLFRFMDLLRYLFHDLKLFLKKPTVYGAVEGKRLPMIGRPATTHSFFDASGSEELAGKKMILNVPPLQVNASVERIYE